MEHDGVENGIDNGIDTWVARRAARQPDAVALVDGGTGGRLTYRELEARVSARVSTLMATGVRAGDRVALLGENSTAYLEWLFAVARTGAVSVPLNTRLLPDEVAYMLRDSGSRLLVHSPTLATLATGALERPTPVERVLDLAGEPGPAGDLPVHGARGASPCAIIYTSGTTGQPKGAILTHDNMFWNAVNLVTAGKGLSRDDVTVAAAPLFHIGALGLSALPVLYAGGTVVVVPAFDPVGLVDLMAREGVTTQFLVPAMWAAVARYGDLEHHPLPALRWGLVGGAPCPLTVIEHFRDLGYVLCEGFGMTELSPAALFLDSSDIATHAGSVGRPFLHVDARLVDADGELARVGVIGELELRGPTVFAGYWGNPEETAAAMHDGWFRSGDLGVTDAEGFVTLVDRRKDMIITGGENVYPIEVEQVMHRHPSVVEVAVIGVGDPTWGESVVAVAVIEGEVDPGEVLAWTRERIAHYKAPSRIELVDELPRNATGKILKRVLRERYAGSAASVSR
ncbi:MAG: long-chain fatty acid--CoA ligase [Actinomycetota bacterium]|nr:long-chain fatty acid--CoA ligase [Actinomycetota bacterium]